MFHKMTPLGYVLGYMLKLSVFYELHYKYKKNYYVYVYLSRNDCVWLLLTKLVAAHVLRFQGSLLARNDWNHRCIDISTIESN